MLVRRWPVGQATRQRPSETGSRVQIATVLDGRPADGGVAAMLRFIETRRIGGPPRGADRPTDPTRPTQQDRPLPRPVHRRFEWPEGGN
uniref:Uncharacterized protein n=1 Tax=Plectus sambesii TaxID=2011161 RepID=A0A914UHX7_9BILA